MPRLLLVLAVLLGASLGTASDVLADCDASKLPNSCGRWVIKQNETDIPLVRMTPATKFVAIYRVCLQTRNATVSVKSQRLPAVTVNLSAPDATNGPPVCADISALPDDTLMITRTSGSARLVGSYRLVFAVFNG